jgi:hypothetical protein
MPRYKNTATVTVGNTESNVIYLNETVPMGLIVTGSVITGSLVSFLVSNDGVNFYPLYDSSSTEVSLAVSTTPRAYSLNPEAFMGWNFVKARLGTSGSAKAQKTYDTSLELTTDSM